MRSITEIALEAYPPKGMADPQDWGNDENAELRKAYMQGYERAVHDMLQLVNSNHYDNLEELAMTMNEEHRTLNDAMKASMKEIIERRVTR